MLKDGHIIQAETKIESITATEDGFVVFDKKFEKIDMIFIDGFMEPNFTVNYKDQILSSVEIDIGEQVTCYGTVDSSNYVQGAKIIEAGNGVVRSSFTLTNQNHDDTIHKNYSIQYDPINAINASVNIDVSDHEVAMYIPGIDSFGIKFLKAGHVKITATLQHNPTNIPPTEITVTVLSTRS